MKLSEDVRSDSQIELSLRSILYRHPIDTFINEPFTVGSRISIKAGKFL
jgi:hypothetical protein